MSHARLALATNAHIHTLSYGRRWSLLRRKQKSLGLHNVCTFPQRCAVAPLRRRYVCHRNMHGAVPCTCLNAELRKPTATAAAVWPENLPNPVRSGAVLESFMRRMHYIVLYGGTRTTFVGMRQSAKIAGHAVLTYTHTHTGCVM